MLSGMEQGKDTKSRTRRISHRSSGAIPAGPPQVPKRSGCPEPFHTPPLPAHAGDGQNPETIWLAPRERQIAWLVASGNSDKEIANQLGLTESTVGWYMDRIYRGCAVHSRAALTALLLAGGHPELALESSTPQ